MYVRVCVMLRDVRGDAAAPTDGPSAPPALQVGY